MTTWNYRICRETLGDGSPHMSIREVFYDKDGKVEGWSADPIAPAGETWMEISDELAKMSAAIGHPALDLETRKWLPPDGFGRKATERHRNWKR